MRQQDKQYTLKYYRKYAHLLKRDLNDIPTYKVIKDFCDIKKDALILDIGCGLGYLLNWFSIDPYNYDEYDMAKPVLKCSYDAMAWCERIWKIHKTPMFVLRSISSLRSFNDVKLGLTGLRSLQGHEADQRWDK